MTYEELKIQRALGLVQVDFGFGNQEILDSCTLNTRVICGSMWAQVCFGDTLMFDLKIPKELEEKIDKVLIGTNDKKGQEIFLDWLEEQLKNGIDISYLEF